MPLKSNLRGRKNVRIYWRTLNYWRESDNIIASLATVNIIQLVIYVNFNIQVYFYMYRRYVYFFHAKILVKWLINNHFDRLYGENMSYLADRDLSQKKKNVFGGSIIQKQFFWLVHISWVSSSQHSNA